MKPTVALCMVVKNEQDGLERAITSAAPWVDETIVLDTGSTDDTVHIAHELGASVHHFEFTNGIDLGAAKTRSMQLARTDWALFLDGDTALDASSGPILRDIAAACSNPLSVGAAVWKNYGGDGRQHDETPASTLVPLTTGARWVGRWHSFIVHPDGSEFQNRLVADLIIHHWGFTTANLLKKGTVERSEELVLLQLDESPEYAKVWTDALQRHCNDDKAVAGLELLDRFKEALKSGVVRDVGQATQFQVAFYEALTAFGADRFERAAQAAEEALNIAPAKDMTALLAAIDASRGNDREAFMRMIASEAIRDELHKFTGQGPWITSKMFCLIARAAERLGEVQRALNWYSKGMSIHPTFIQGPAWFADFLIQIGNIGAAAALLTEALNSKPEDTEFATRLAQIWRRNSETDFVSSVREARLHWPENLVFHELSATTAVPEITRPERT